MISKKNKNISSFIICYEWKLTLKPDRFGCLKIVEPLSVEATYSNFFTFLASSGDLPRFVCFYII